MRRIASKVVVVLLLGGATATAVWFWPAENADGAFSSSVIEADEVDAASRVGGRLLTVEVDEGQEIETGAVLATLDCAPLEARREELVARLERARAEERAAASQVQGAGAQRTVAATQARAARARAAALTARREAAARAAQRVEQVGEFATEEQRDQSRVTADELVLQVSAAERDVDSLRAQARASGAQRAAAEARAEAASHAVAALEATLGGLELDLAECTIRAPQGGVVETVFYEPGELLPQGRPVVRLLDRRSLEATLYLSAADLGAVDVGRSVSVRVDSFPDQRFEGRVTTVAVEALYTPRTIQTRSDRERLVYPVTIALSDESGRLLPGMPVEIWMEGPR
jgi:HlyD family secretion protein